MSSGYDTSKLVDSIQDRGINQVYILGGYGTQMEAALIFEEVRKRGLKVSVVGIPKTIDNDILLLTSPLVLTLLLKRHKEYILSLSKALTYIVMRSMPFIGITSRKICCLTMSK